MCYALSFFSFIRWILVYYLLGNGIPINVACYDVYIRLVLRNVECVITFAPCYRYITFFIYQYAIIEIIILFFIVYGFIVVFFENLLESFVFFIYGYA